MTTLLAAMDDELMVACRDGYRWQTYRRLTGVAPRCLAVDLQQPGRVFCGTGRSGLWRSTDSGDSWTRVGADVLGERITAVAVTADAAVYAGTEPSAVFRSVNGGDTWEQCRGLTELPSADEWHFPPRPDTHHVRWIEPDPNENGRIYVCIEAGALVQSPDGGETWQDRAPGGPYDTHTLATHPDCPGRLYSAAGDGYYESEDGGNTWRQRETGLEHRYAWGLALHPGDPELRLVSAASGPRTAHNANAAHSLVYRRTAHSVWQPAIGGLPRPQGTTVASLVAHPHKHGRFYLANNHGLYYSTNAGEVWRRIEIPWPTPYRSQRVNALVAVVS